MFRLQIYNFALIFYCQYPVNKTEISLVKNDIYAVSLSRNKKIKYTMFDFDQYLGFLAFLTILTIGFWLMIFLLTFVIPYWIGGSMIEMVKEKMEERKEKRA